MDFATGFAIGFLFVILLVIIVSLNKNKKIGGEYDERQQIVRCKGYKAGFFTMLILNMIIICLTNDDGCLKYITSDAAVLISVFIALIVFAVYCILNDGYFGVFEKPKSTICLLLLISFINILIGIANYKEWFYDGKLSSGIMNFVCGITLFVISLAGVVKLMLNKREDE